MKSIYDLFSIFKKFNLYIACTLLCRGYFGNKHIITKKWTHSDLMTIKLVNMV